MRSHRTLAAWAVLLLVLAALPWLGLSRYYLNLVDQSMIFAIAVLGLYFVLGMTGQLSLAQAAFFGLGAYTSAILATRFGLPVWLNLPVSVVVAAVFGVILGVPSLKLSGHYLAMTTIGFGIILDLVFFNWRPVTGGADGIPGVKPTSIFGMSLAHPGLFFYVIWVFFAIAIFVAARVARSRLGRGLNAIRENELAAEAVGVDSTRYKVAAFTLSAAYGGLAGSLWTHLALFIAPETFNFDVSVTMLAMLVIGGSTTVVGSVIGAFLLTLLPEFLRFLQSSYFAVYGAAIIVLMVFMPDGIAGMAIRLWSRARGREEEAPKMLGQSGEVAPDATAAG
jgi:ABC-type branched-subunit amino acid transport system permease subunit